MFGYTLFSVSVKQQILSQGGFTSVLSHEQQAAPAAPGQSSSVTQDNDMGRGLAKRAARHAARPAAQDPERRHKEQAPPASCTP